MCICVSVHQQPPFRPSWQFFFGSKAAQRRPPAQLNSMQASRPLRAAQEAARAPAPTGGALCQGGGVSWTHGGKLTSNLFSGFAKKSSVSSKWAFLVLPLAVTITGTENRSLKNASSPPGVDPNSVGPSYFPCSLSLRRSWQSRGLAKLAEQSTPPGGRPSQPPQRLARLPAPRPGARPRTGSPSGRRAPPRRGGAS